MLEALGHVVPEVLLDTTGCPFSYPVARIAGARVAAYVHYPTISTDMLRRVAARSSLYNNAEDVASSPLLSMLKLAYYYCFAGLYALVGSCAHVRSGFSLKLHNNACLDVGCLWGLTFS